MLRRAHGFPHPGLAPANERVTNSLHGHGAVAEASVAESNAADAEPVGPGSVGGDAASWIGAVGVCKGTDLVVGYVADTAALCLVDCLLHHFTSRTMRCLVFKVASYCSAFFV